MTRKEALSYIKSAAGHLIATDRQVMGMALLEAWDALRQPGWVRTADRVPTKADSNSDWDVIAVYDCPEENEQYVVTKYCKYVAESPEDYPYWMPLPPLPETVGLEGTKINGLKGESE